MRYRTIAGTDIQLSEVGFGVWTVTAGWWGDRSDEEAITLLRQAFDRGITFFDTADTYGNGRGETILAQAFPGADRDEIVIGTKFGYDWQSNIGKRREGQREAPHCFEPEFLERVVLYGITRRQIYRGMRERSAAGAIPERLGDDDLEKIQRRSGLPVQRRPCR